MDFTHIINAITSKPEEPKDSEGRRLDPVGDLINQAHKQQGLLDPPRPHLGASVIGKPCKRAVWLQFRFANIEIFEGRLLRLFRRGKQEETNIIADLRLAGLTVLDEYADLSPLGLDKKADGSQYRIMLGSHVSGSTDGFAKGHPEAPDVWHVLEAKTHNDKSFKTLVNQGVEKSKPEHYVQMQTYMVGTGLQWALYYAVNKNDDEIYTERVKLDPYFAAQTIDDSKALATSMQMPKGISQNESFYICKMCSASDFCHKGKQIAPKNCRTCVFAIPEKDDSWTCIKWNVTIPFEGQLQGCDAHTMHPDLMGDEPCN